MNGSGSKSKDEEPPAFNLTPESLRPWSENRVYLQYGFVYKNFPPGALTTAG